jgi:Ca-activated chloride channel homolog
MRARIRKQYSGLFLLLAHLWIAPAWALQDPVPGHITGTVVSAEGPVRSARIGIIDETSAAMIVRETTADGRFQADGLRPGHRYRVVVTRFGYDAATFNHVTTGTDLAVNLTASAAGRGALRDSPAGIRSAPVPGDDTAPTFRVAVGLVTLSVAVKDSGGTHVRGLKKEDFTIFERGAPQEIVQFSEENTPASYVLLLDTSSSMEGDQLREAKRAAHEFIRQTGPNDELALIAFTEQVEVVQPLTAERPPLQQAVETLSARGGTALYDAVAQGLDLLREARYPRRFVILFSDGIDADSRRKFSDIEKLVQASDAAVFAVGEYLGPERARFMTGARYYKEPALEENYNPVWVLRQLSEVSGGAAFFPAAGEPLTPVFERIAREIRDQYVLAYVPPPPSPEPEFRTIEVKLKTPVPGVTVRTRKGYLSPGAGPLTEKR